MSRSHDELSTEEQSLELAREAWLYIVRVFNSEEVRQVGLQAAEEQDLAARYFSVLLNLPLDTAEGKSMGQLAEDCFSTRSYMTVIIDGLEERGLVVRQVDPDDRRVKQVHLTQEGVTVVQRSHERLSQPPSGLFLLSTEELRTLRDLLGKAAVPYPW